MNNLAEKLEPIANTGDAERAIDNLNTIMDRLIEAVEEETQQARAGRLLAAVEKDEAKVELARRYAAESERLHEARAMIATSLPQALDALRKRHEAFRELLQTNLTVLATAHAVSEGIIRGVSNELARKHQPTTYGASGRPSAPAGSAGMPLAFSRKL